jgi:integrase
MHIEDADDLKMTQQVNNESDGQGCASAASESQKNAQAGKKAKARYSKDDLRYWMQTVKKPRFTSDDGEVVESVNYAVSIQWRGRRKNLSLGTPSREAAAAKARAIYREVVVNDWGPVLKRLRPAMEVKRPDPTIGEIITAIRERIRKNPQTLESYFRSLRRIASAVCGVPLDSSRFDLTGGGGREQWLERVHAVKLSQLTEDRLQKWTKSYLAAAKPDPKSQRSAQISLNSLIRSVRCLFSPKILPHLSTLELPEELPFAKLECERCSAPKYQSTIDAEKLLAEARAELPEQQLKIFLLALFGGLRRAEIDLLEWSSFLWDQGIVRIEMTDFFKPKTYESSGDVFVGPQFMAAFRGYRAKTKERFVIESDSEPKIGKLYKAYRCKEHFQKLTAWLRFKGVKANAPLHALRKECGSLVNAKVGIHAASRHLRHSSIQITAAIYADNRVRASTGLEHLLAAGTPEPNIVPIQPEPEQKVAKESAQ